MVPFLLERNDEPILYQIDHRDGLRVTHLLLPKFVTNWIVSLRLGSGEIRACQVEAGREGRDFYRSFAYLNLSLDEYFQTGQPPTSPLRTHLVTGMLQAVLQALPENGQWVQTPNLAIAY